MSEAAMAIAGPIAEPINGPIEGPATESMAVPTPVSIVVPVGRNGWVRKEVTLHYEGSRLIKADGIELAQTGPLGLTGTIYLVKDSLRYDSRQVMRVERQKIVNGKVVDMRNWGEIEETVAKAA